MPLVTDVEAEHLGTRRTAAQPPQYLLYGLVAITFIRSVVPSAVNFLELQHVVPEPGQTVLRTGLSQQVTAASSALLGVFAVFVLMVNRDRLRLSFPWLVACATVTLYFLRAETLDRNSILSLVILLVVLTAVSGFDLNRNSLVVFGVLGLLLAAYSIALIFLLPGNAYMIIPGKSTYALVQNVTSDRQLAGPLSHSNELGVATLLAIPFVFLLKRKLLAVVALSFMIVTIVFTQSRTSITGLLVAVAFVLVWVFVSVRSRRLVTTAFVGAGVIAVIAFPTTALAARFNLSGREIVWADGLQAWAAAGRPVLGIGRYWSEGDSPFRSVSTLASSGHNLFVQFLVTGGPLLLVLALVLLTVVLRRARALDHGHRLPVASLYLVLLAVVSVTEFAFVPSVTAELFASAAMPLLLMASARPTSVDPSLQADQ